MPKHSPLPRTQARIYIYIYIPPTLTCCPHSIRYDDKFLLAESAANSTIAALLNTFEMIGLDTTKLELARQWALTDGKVVTLRFESSTRCTFVREVSRQVERPSSSVQVRDENLDQMSMQDLRTTAFNIMGLARDFV